MTATTTTTPKRTTNSGNLSSLSHRAIAPIELESREEESREIIIGIDNNNEENSIRSARDDPFRGRRPPPPLPKWLALLRYVTLATVALLLTIFCPGGPTTILWRIMNDDDNNNQTMQQLNTSRFWPLFFFYSQTLLFFVRVHCVDPGFLSQAIMDDEFGDGLDYMGRRKKAKKTKATHPSTTTTLEHGNRPDDGLAHPTYDEHAGPLLLDGADVDPEEQTTNDDDFAALEVLEPLVQNKNHTWEDRGVSADAIGASRTAMMTRRKVCRHCQFAPPLRSHHCSRCQRCVATFDHHCELVGNCIGERNRCLFWWFLLSQAIAFALCNQIVGSSSLGLSTLLFASAPISTATTFQALVVVGTKIYLYCLSFTAYVMLAMHTFFSAANLTTFEVRFGSGINNHDGVDYLRNVHSVMDLPFSQGGCFGNVTRLCCTGRPDSTTAFPTVWRLPETAAVTDSENWWENLWENKYWSCC